MVKDTVDDLDPIRRHIRDVPDFPKEGITFKDITPILLRHDVFTESVHRMCQIIARERVEKIVSPEARGFWFGTAVALRLGRGFVPVRKPGKLPHETVSVSYDLEYGQDTVVMHKDAIDPGDHVLLVDDVLATGGTMKACAELVESQGGVVSCCLFFLELGFLNGREKLKDYRIRSLIRD